MSSPTVPSSRNGIGIITYQIAKVRKLGLTSASVLLSNPHHNPRVLIHLPNSACAPSKLYSTARVTVSEFKCDHVHSCLEPSSVFLLAGPKSDVTVQAFIAHSLCTCTLPLLPHILPHLFHLCALHMLTHLPRTLFPQFSSPG